MGKRNRSNKNTNNITNINSVKKKKHKIKNKVKLPYIIISVIILYVAIIFIRQELVIRDLTKKNETSEQELKNIQADIKDLKQKINKSDTVKYIEKIAREELDMIKPHEIIYKDKNKQKSDDI